MQVLKAAWFNIHATVKRYFPEHQIYFRTNGNVRFLTVSTRFQMGAVCTAVLLTAWVAVASGLYFSRNEALQDKQRALVAEREQVAQMQGRMQALSTDMQDLKGGMKTVIGRFEERTQFLQKLYNNKLNISALTARARPMSVDAASAAKALANAPRDQQAMIRQFDHQQLSFVSGAARTADARFEQLDKLLRHMGLNAAGLTSQSNSAAMGGPLVRASFERGAYSTLESTAWPAATDQAVSTT